jgi:hypothetical protein
MTKLRKRKRRRQPLPKDQRDRYTCNDCGVNVLTSGEFYMLHPEIWQGQLGLGWSDNLCIGCLEQRLGRRVGPLFGGDFCSTPNYPWMYPPSPRLMDRYGFKQDAKGKWDYAPQQRKQRGKR